MKTYFSFFLGLHLCCFMVLILAYPQLILAEDEGATARGIFTMLPATIFETTAEGLSDEEKQDLLRTGKSEFWEIVGETPDVMVFTSSSFPDKAVALRLFRNDRDGSTEAAVGTLGEPICTMEMWHQDISGRIVPVDPPTEPEIKEFFNKNRKLKGGVQHSVLICIGLGGLKAQPIFWNKTGMQFPVVDNEISFQWNGHEFEKNIQPINHNKY